MSETTLLGKPSPTPEVLGKPRHTAVLKTELKTGEILFPADHVPGIKVPKGGSSCESCEYLKDAKKRLCGNQYFIGWNKSDVIPEPIDEYCSDWFDWKGSGG